MNASSAETSALSTPRWGCRRRGREGVHGCARGRPDARRNPLGGGDVRAASQQGSQCWTPSCLLIAHCCAIERMLLVSQYSTSPEGKKKNITEKASGIIHISLACIGSGGVGFSH